MRTDKEKFELYEEVRTSGVTNMFNTKMVSRLSGLDRTEILEVMKRYDELSKKYKK